MNGQEEKLRQEILGDARRKAARTVKRAQRDVEKMLKAVRDQHEKLAEERHKAAGREAEEKHRAVSASIEHEIRKRWLTAREQALDEYFEDMLPELERGDDIDRSRSLRELLCEALSATGPVPVRLRLRSADLHALDADALAACLAEAFAPEGREGAAIEVVEEEGIKGGLVLETRDGRMVFDNTYATRLNRLKGTLRADVCTGFDADEEPPQDG